LVKEVTDMTDTDQTQKKTDTADYIIINENKTAVALSLKAKIVKSSLSLLKGTTFTYIPGPGVVSRAKGTEAERMIENARETGTSIIQYPHLAEALYSDCEPGTTISKEDWKYSAIFHVLALIYHEDGRVTITSHPGEIDLSERTSPEPIYFKPLMLEVGNGLLPLIENETELLKRISRIRKDIASGLGLIVPKILIRDNMNLSPDEYRIKLKGIDAGRGMIRIDRYLAIETKRVKERLKGETSVEPVFGLPALWITENELEKAERSGYTVVDGYTLISTHLTQIMTTNASRLLGTQEVKNILDSLSGEYPALVEEVIKLFSLNEIKQVLCALLREGVSIRNIVDILESLSEYGLMTKKPEILIEKVRQQLGLHICSQYVDKSGVLYVFTLHPQGEQKLVDLDEGAYTDLFSYTESGSFKHFYAALDAALKQRKKDGGFIPVLVCSQEVRPIVQKLTQKVYPNLPVLSTREIPDDVKIKKCGDISV
jgi:flagellar biosynthesis component FlhA/type III secretion system FlhB-like substrate exporter